MVSAAVRFFLCELYAIKILISCVRASRGTCPPMDPLSFTLITHVDSYQGVTYSIEFYIGV